MAGAKQQFNIYLPADLVRMVKHAAIDEGRSLSVYVEDVLRNHLELKSPESPESPG